MALKELGLSLTQARRLLDGITLDELHGMLMLRRAQLEHELLEHRNQLLGIEARLRHLAREGAMPADDIVVKKIPATGVVVIAGKAPAFGPANIVPVVNHLVGEFERLEIGDRIKNSGPRMILYDAHEEGITVYLAQPVTEPPGELPRRPGTASCRRSRPPPRCAAARPRASSRSCITTWSGGSTSGATGPS